MLEALVGALRGRLVRHLASAMRRQWSARSTDSAGASVPDRVSKQSRPPGSLPAASKPDGG